MTLNQRIQEEDFEKQGLPYLYSRVCSEDTVAEQAVTMSFLQVFISKPDKVISSTACFVCPSISEKIHAQNINLISLILQLYIIK